MSKKRVPVPKKIDREIKVEAGHKCAVWNCSERYGLEKHHIDGDPANNTKENIIFLCATHHKMADDGLITPEECRMYKKLLKDMLEGKILPKIKESLPVKGIEVEPENWLEKSILSLGKKYVMWRYHDFNANLTKEYIAFGIISLLLFTPFIWFTQNIGEKTLDMTFIMISFVSFLIGAFIVASLILVAKSRCPKCNKNFGIRRIKSLEVGRKKLDKTDAGTRYEVNYDNTYKCEFCDYSFQWRERQTEII